MHEAYFTGDDLIELGITPGPQFGRLLKEVNAAFQAHKDSDEDTAHRAVAAVIDGYKATVEAERLARLARVVPLRDTPVDVARNIEAFDADEEKNVADVMEAMTLLARTPTVEHVAVMPDACPAGAISVGGVVAARNAIHPGWHSADICCSMFATNLGKADPKAVLDAVCGVTHFGPGGRARHNEAKMPADLLEMLQSGNRFLDDAKLQGQARSHLMTQGDGNHFSYVGRSDATGDTWLVSHHGSRGFGAQVYKKGMEVAERFRKDLCPELDAGHAWIPADSEEGVAYWEALEIVRAWTKANHALLHDAVVRALGADVRHQRWNPHNFVFRDKADPSLFWHAKGATPVHNAFLSDTDGVQIVPLNMAQPILFVQGQKTANGFGFAPHGAGRNLSRTQHKKRMGGETDEAIFARETAGIDARFHCGVTDISELPSAYKNADQVQEQMKRFGLATVVDRILPYGAVMAGDHERDAPWRKKKQAAQA